MDVDLTRRVSNEIILYYLRMEEDVNAMNVLELIKQFSATATVMLMLGLQSLLLIVVGIMAHGNVVSLVVGITIVIVAAIAFMALTYFFMLMVHNRVIRRFSELSQTLIKGGSIVANDEINEALDENTKDEAKKTYRQLKIALAKISEREVRVMESVKSSSIASENIHAASEELSSILDKQTLNTIEVTKAIEDMVYTIVGNAAINAQAAQCSKQSGDTARVGGDVVVRTIAKIQSISDVVEQSVEMIEQLIKSCDDIGEMVSMIGTIASQTNLLALNAAIEAARAGEQGRGFAVVADEVRCLANNTTKATRRIEDVVTTIQTGVVETAGMMKQVNEEVSVGISLADEAGRSLDAIVEETQEVLDMIHEIASAGDESANTATDKTAYHLDRVSNTTKETAGYVEDATRKMADLKAGLNSWKGASDELPSLLADFNTVNCKQYFY
mgnify:CR=1 FL=1